MQVKKALKRPMTSFVVLTYVIFLVFFMIIGGAMVLGAPDSLAQILQTISAWSSTFAFIILFKKIYPEERFTDFVKKQFATKLRFSVIGTALILQVVIVAIIAVLISNTNGDLSFVIPSIGTLIITFFITLSSGPLGEELGWRGYLLNELQKKHSSLKAALIIGILWGLWHTPIWFTSYTGSDLIKYAVLFMIGILSFSVILTLFYSLSKNLLVPIIMHQLFNFSYVFFKGELLNIFEYIMLFYFVVAIILIVINPKEILYKSKKQLEKPINI